MQPQRCTPALRSTALLLCCSVSWVSAVTPVQKVTELLNGMLEKGKQEKHEEQKAFAAMTTFCTMTQKEKKRLVGAAEDQIMDLDADISKAEAQAGDLSDGIQSLDSDLATWSQEEAEATALRNKERTDYDASHQDMSDSIDALDRAITVLKSRSADAPQRRGEQEAALLELQRVFTSSKQVPAHAKQVLQSWLQMRGDGADGEASPPEANAYEFQSGTIVDLLEKIMGRFEEQLRQLQKEEMNTRHNHEKLKQDWHDKTVYAEKTKVEKVSDKSRLLAEAAAARGDMEETQAGKKADEGYLQDLAATCEIKSADYEKRQKLRDEEIAAIGKAIEIVSGAFVAGAAEKHLPAAALLQGGQPCALALVQLGSSPSAAQPASVAAFLSQRARKTGSALLASVADHAASDPFAKVRQMIKELLARLLEEASEEAEHKGWCDEQLATNKESRDTLGSEVESLTAQVDELSTLEVTLAAEAKELSEAIAEIDANVKTASEERAKEKANNQATIDDAKSGQAAVTEALKVLKEFYAAASEATALLQHQQRQGQTPAEDLPTTWDSAYTGMQGESKGVLGMLDVIQSDFARLEAETSFAEEAAQRAHQKFLEDSEVDKAIKDRTMRHKGYKRDSTLRILHETQKELASTQEMLTASLKYYDKLKPSCIDTGVSYTERVEKRKEEIQSLQEALKILEAEDLSGAQ